ncbi:MAG: IS4 family transposase, partial [Myxococcales bacterium]|nr:IS4 family transposase [Myxococcales bacterium]
MNTPPCAFRAEQEFGSARLGDAGRTARLIGVAGQAASTPGGKVTDVFSEGAAREGAFRLLENEDVSVEEIAW